MMNKILLTCFTALIFLASCKNKDAASNEVVLETTGIQAVGPYLTHDQKGVPVLCWTEQSKDSLYQLKYARYDVQKNRFSTAIAIPASIGSNTSAESMGKVAFKADGTVIALFSKRFPREKNPYAGAIYYSMSVDDGRSWSVAKFLHADTAHTYGRSFFDVTRLKNGELAAIWLDGRFGKAIKGSALFFNQTVKGEGFGVDTCLDKGTCECCRTAILADGAGNIHLAYRSITFPSALADKQVRDMVYKVSADQGKTFSGSKPISKDNWEINGCPHSGPSLAVVKNTVHAVWFTAGGTPGLYTTDAIGIGSDFNKRRTVTTAGRHPQLLALENGKLLMVAEESIDVPEAMHMNHSHGSMKMSHEQAVRARITLRTLAAGKPDEVRQLTDGKSADNHAVLGAVGNELLVAWVREEKNMSKIYYTHLRP